MDGNELYLSDGEEDFDILGEDYWNYYASDIDYESFSLYEVWEYCVQPVLQGLNLVLVVLGLCLLQRIVVSIRILPAIVPYAYTCLIGCSLLVQMIGLAHFGHFCILISMCIPVFFFQNLIPGYLNRGSLVLAICVGYVLSVQFFVLDAVSFLQFRGPLMIVMMKLISVGYDSDNWTTDDMNSVNLFRIVSYLFDSTTVLFGPWISFKQFTEIQGSRNFMSIGSILRCLFKFAFSIVCLLYSQCFISWLIPEDYDSSSKWINAYQTAQSFRFSHYFISLVSETAVLIVGSEVIENDFCVAKPWKIEIPRSLVDVVINWNRPMHEFMKNYIFRRVKYLGNAAAVFATYATSSILHGLNFQISAVLFSLGVYTYTEHVIREKLARIYGSCIRSKACQEECDHNYKQFHPITLVVNCAFLCLALFHLTYVGMVFNDDPEEAEKGYTWLHTISRWSDVNFLSHYVAFGMLLVAKFI